MNTDQQYIDFDPGAGGMDEDLSCQEVRIVTTRKRHQCWQGLNGPEPNPHWIEAGQRARYDKALSDGKWGAFYVCLPCMDALIAEYGNG